MLAITKVGKGERTWRFHFEPNLNSNLQTWHSRSRIHDKQLDGVCERVGRRKGARGAWGGGALTNTQRLETPRAGMNEFI